MPTSTVWATRGCGAILWYLIYSFLVCGRCYGSSVFVFSLTSGGNQVSFQQVKVITQEQQSRSLSSPCFHGYVLFFDTFCFYNVLIFLFSAHAIIGLSCYEQKCLVIYFSGAETPMNTWDKVFKNGPSKGCLPKILLGLFLNTLSHMLYQGNKESC